MKLSNLATVSYLFMALFYALPGYGQISSSKANQKLATDYSKTDTIYIFNQNSTVKNAIFTALNPRGGNATFTWSKYNSTSRTFVDFKTKANVTSDTIDRLIEKPLGGGYRVTISVPAKTDTSFTFWFYPHKMALNVLKNAENCVLWTKYTCDYVKLDGILTTDTFTYFRPEAPYTKYILNNKIKYVWTGDPVPTNTLPKKASITNNFPPTKDTWYTLTVTDTCNYNISDKVKYISIIPKAIFTAIVDSTIKPIDMKRGPQSKDYNSAPLFVRITNTSENANKYVLYPGDGDTIDLVNTDTVYTYYQSKKYTLILYAYKINDVGGTCIDSTTQTITVDNPDYELPNIFIPGSTTTYKPSEPSKFMPANVSIGNFRFRIYSRWGKEVYKEEKNEMDRMVGWDGNIHGSLAAEGIYYYVLEMHTYGKDSPLTKPNKVAGFFYLYHQK